MRIEVGKVYKTRDGNPVYIVSAVEDRGPAHKDGYRFVGMILQVLGGRVFANTTLYLHDGHYFDDKKAHIYDIVKELDVPDILKPSKRDDEATKRMKAIGMIYYNSPSSEAAIATTMVVNFLNNYKNEFRRAFLVKMYAGWMTGLALGFTFTVVMMLI